MEQDYEYDDEYVPQRSYGRGDVASKVQKLNLDAFESIAKAVKVRPWSISPAAQQIEMTKFAKHMGISEDTMLEILMRVEADTGLDGLRAAYQAVADSGSGFPPSKRFKVDMPKATQKGMQGRVGGFLQAKIPAQKMRSKSDLSPNNKQPGRGRGRPKLNVGPPSMTSPPETWLGHPVERFWEEDENQKEGWYAGTIDSWDATKGEFKITYPSKEGEEDVEGGWVEQINLHTLDRSKWRWPHQAQQLRLPQQAPRSGPPRQPGRPPAVTVPADKVADLEKFIDRKVNDQASLAQARKLYEEIDTELRALLKALTEDKSDGVGRVGGTAAPAAASALTAAGPSAGQQMDDSAAAASAEPDSLIVLPPVVDDAVPMTGLVMSTGGGAAGDETGDEADD